jgi:aspartokinase-like uncharacterized kinase
MSQSSRNEPAVRVVKVGGSLLDEPRLAEVLRRWLVSQSPAVPVLVAGGGRLVDAVRQLDRTHRLGEERSHWLALRAMRVTASFLSDLLSESQLVERFDALIDRLYQRKLASDSHPIVFDCWQFLCEVEPHASGARLPQTWQATSDSVAARLAFVLRSSGLPLGELVLLKSTLPAPGSTLLDAVAADILDECFAGLAAALPRVRLVNLRSELFDERVWSAE